MRSTLKPSHHQPPPLTRCWNGDGRPLALTSSLLCDACQAAFDARFREIFERLHPRSAPAEAILATVKTWRGGLMR